MSGNKIVPKKERSFWDSYFEFMSHPFVVGFFVCGILMAFAFILPKILNKIL